MTTPTDPNTELTILRVANRDLEARLAAAIQRYDEIQDALKAHWEDKTNRMQTTDADIDLWMIALEGY